MSEKSERRFYKGSARWIIVGIIAALAIIFIVAMAFGSTIFQGAPKQEYGLRLRISRRKVVLDTIPPTLEEQLSRASKELPLTLLGLVLSRFLIPRSLLVERQALQTPIAGQQGVNNSTNSTNGGLANLLSENITSLTGTSS